MHTASQAVWANHFWWRECYHLQLQTLAQAVVFPTSSSQTVRNESSDWQYCRLPQSRLHASWACCSTVSPSLLTKYGGTCTQMPEFKMGMLPVRSHVFAD